MNKIYEHWTSSSAPFVLGLPLSTYCLFTSNLFKIFRMFSSSWFVGRSIGRSITTVEPTMSYLIFIYRVPHVFNFPFPFCCDSSSNMYSENSFVIFSFSLTFIQFWRHFACIVILYLLNIVIAFGRENQHIMYIPGGAGGWQWYMGIQKQYARCTIE